MIGFLKIGIAIIHTSISQMTLQFQYLRNLDYMAEDM